MVVALSAVQERRARRRRRAAADRAVHRDLRHLRQRRRPRAELPRRRQAARRSAPGLEGAARAGQPARPAGLRLRDLRRGARRGAGRRSPPSRRGWTTPAPAPSPAAAPAARPASASPTCRSTRPTRWCAAPPSLQLTADARAPVASLPPALWSQLGLAAGDTRARRARRRAGRAAGAARRHARRRRRARAGRPRRHRHARRDVRRHHRRESLRRTMLDTVTTFGSILLGAAWPVVWTLVKIVALVLPLMICVAYLTLWERKAHRLDPDPPGPEPRRPARPAAADRRRGEADLQGDHPPDRGEQEPVPPRPGDDHHAGAGRLGGRARSAPRSRWPTSTPACCS